MNYSQIKKLDEDTQKNLQEGSGPVSECLCSLLAPPDNQSRGLRGSIKRALASMGGRRGAGGKGAAAGGRAGAAYNSAGGVYTSKEAVKRKSSCGKCGCDNEKVFMKTSVASIRITSPDISSICPCPNSACMPDKDKFNNNISVTVERVELSDIDTDDERAKDRKTQVRERLDRPSLKVQGIPSGKIKENAEFIGEVLKRPSLKYGVRERLEKPSETVQEKTEPMAKRLEKSSAKELVEHIWKGLKNIEDQIRRSIEEDGLDENSINSRPEDYGSIEDSGSFSSRMEKDHDDVMKRSYF